MMRIGHAGKQFAIAVGLCLGLAGVCTPSLAGEAVLFKDGRYLEIESHEISILDSRIRLNIGGGEIWVQKSAVSRIENDRGVAWENATWTQRQMLAEARRTERQRLIAAAATAGQGSSQARPAPRKSVQQIVLSAWEEEAPIIRRAGR